MEQGITITLAPQEFNFLMECMAARMKTCRDDNEILQVAENVTHMKGQFTRAAQANQQKPLQAVPKQAEPDTDTVPKQAEPDTDTVPAE